MDNLSSCLPRVSKKNYLSNTGLNFYEYKYELIDFIFLHEFSDYIGQINPYKNVILNFKGVSFVNLSSLSYFEAIILLLCEDAKKNIYINLVISENIISQQYIYASLIINCIAEDGLLDKEKFKDEFNKELTNNDNEMCKVRRIYFKNENLSVEKVFTVIRSFLPDVQDANQVGIIFSELMNNISNHDNSISTLIIHISICSIQGFDVIEYSFINNSGRIISENIKNALNSDLKSENLTKIRCFLNENTEHTDDMILIPLLFVEGISTRSGTMCEKMMGGTGLYKFLEYLKKIDHFNQKDIEFKSFLISGDIKIDLSNMKSYDSLESFCSNFSEDVGYIHKTKFNFKGLIYNFFYVKERN